MLRWQSGICGTVLTVLCLAACAGGAGGKPDEYVDRGLSTYQEEVEYLYAGLESGILDPHYDASRDFYVYQRAQLRSLLTRAEARGGEGHCAGTRFLRQLEAMRAGLPESVEGMAGAAIDAARDGEGDCRVMALRALIAGHLVAEGLHAAYDEALILRPDLLNRVRDLLADGVRDALRELLAADRA
jgi:hypothetical protein